MKIAHFVESFSPLSETFIYDMVMELERQGAQNQVYTINIDNSERNFERAIQLRSNASISNRISYILNRIARREQALVFLNLRIFVKDFIDNIQNDPPDIIITHFGPIGLTCIREVKELKIPIVNFFYGFDISRLLRHKYWVKKYKTDLKLFNGLIGISNHICNKIRVLAPNHESIHLVHLGIESDKSLNTYPSKRITEGIVKCIFVGRFVEKKSPQNLIKSFHEALNRIDDKTKLMLVMIGDGPLFKDSQNLVIELELQDNVKLLGRLSNHVVLEQMKQSHIYVQHSITAKDGDEEGQGVTLVEASALGLPVIATDHNGFSDVVQHGETGYLVEEGNCQEMGKSIAELSQNPAKWEPLGANGVNHILSHFNLTTEVEKLSLYLKKHVDDSDVKR